MIFEDPKKFTAQKKVEEELRHGSLPMPRGGK